MDQVYESDYDALNPDVITYSWLTSTGIVSPGKTNTESPTRISSEGTSMQIASEQSTESAEESLSDEVITSLDWVDINDCKNDELTSEIKQMERSLKFQVNTIEACSASKISV